MAISAADGAYRFDRLPAGDYSVSASRGGFAAQEYGERRSGVAVPVKLADGQALDGIDFALAPAGVIVGQIRDEDDKPFTGATVEALVSRTQQGQPRLVAIASTQSDDRGEFRLTGLPAGQYYVTAFDPAFTNVGDETGVLRYTPTYYPGVPYVEQAERVSVVPNADSKRLVFRLRIVRPARVSGTIGTEDSRQLITGAVIMSPIHGEGLSAVPSQDVMILPDGSFSFKNVPPGNYQIRARGETDPQGTSSFATFRILVEGHDITNLVMTLLPGASVEGTVSLEAGRAAAAPAVTGLRVRAPFTDGTSFGDSLTGTVQADGSYRIRGIMPGNHVIIVEGLPESWVLKSVVYRGHDITDVGLDADRNERHQDVRITVTDAASEIAGVVHDAKGAPVVDATVMIIPIAPQFWRPTSRRFALLHTDAAGRYRIKGLPPGEYRALASIEIDETEAYDREMLAALIRTGAPVSLEELARLTLDLPLTSPSAARRALTRQ
ncbi:MAG: hypothetical protein A3H96_20600 [Acidobacteria bacterium RIFCSPLOWO2_02_FULL_67_36]|nr:MAG: hypothetical protein A3H96_20600 [Acidobacteria bacterium RIFCSPLOWO2_02_FULL_67_36]